VLTVVGVGADGAKFLQVPPVGGKSSKITNVHIDLLASSPVERGSVTAHTFELLALHVPHYDGQPSMCATTGWSAWQVATSASATC
jgi:hypothetical protein